MPPAVVRHLMAFSFFNKLRNKKEHLKLIR